MYSMMRYGWSTVREPGGVAASRCSGAATRARQDLALAACTAPAARPRAGPGASAPRRCGRAHAGAPGRRLPNPPCADLDAVVDPVDAEIDPVLHRRPSGHVPLRVAADPRWRRYAGDEHGAIRQTSVDGHRRIGPRPPRRRDRRSAELGVQEVDRAGPGLLRRRLVVGAERVLLVARTRGRCPGRPRTSRPCPRPRASPPSSRHASAREEAVVLGEVAEHRRGEAGPVRAPSHRAARRSTATAAPMRSPCCAATTSVSMPAHAEADDADRVARDDGLREQVVHRRAHVAGGPVRRQRVHQLRGLVHLGVLRDLAVVQVRRERDEALGRRADRTPR